MRTSNEVRPITAAVGCVPKRVHGSGLFLAAGLTQCSPAPTLGIPQSRMPQGDGRPHDRWARKTYLHH